MGRELQKKKNRSSISKVKHKPKSKKLNLQSNAIIAANWDKNLTLSQNYQKLGLIAKINSRAGGTEKLASYVENTDNTTSDPLGPLFISTKNASKAAHTTTQVERDPETGAILRVVQSKSKKDNPLNDPLNEIEDEEEEESVSRSSAEKSSTNGVVRALEEQASNIAEKRPRQQSQREKEWIANLVEKYGDDLRSMARDRKMNPNQQTEVDIRKRIERWKSGRGVKA
ncbi:MAG: Nucleolar protein 16 [Icmadophila ericetorum]|nr:Nucleolar protein 16 [Icmadophila ericetorum]